jgi:hypothetical protein
MTGKNGLNLIRLWALGSFSALLLFGSATSASADEQGWVLTQRSIKFGDQYVYIGSNGIKVLNPIKGVGLVTTGPSWNVVFFNNKQRTYYAMSFDKWKARSGSTRAPRLNWSHPTPSSVKGLRANQYEYRLGVADAETRSKMKEATYWAATDIHVPARLSELLATTYGTPDNQSIPLRFTYIDPQGRPETLLDTYQEQKTNIPASFFDTPQGYTAARSEADVLLDDQQRQIMNDIAKDLGDTGNASTAASHIPPQGVQLPNGRTVSKDDVNKFIDSLKNK